MAQRRSNHVSRRQFLGLVGAGLLSRMIGFKTLAPALSRVHLHTFDPALTTTTEAVQRIVLAATDLRWLRHGDTVFVKVASNSDLAPPAVTSPAVLEGVVRLLKEAGAATVYVGDMSGALFVRHLPTETIGSTRDCMRKNGLLAAAEAAGATIHCFEEVPFEQAYIPAVPAGNHHWGNELYVAEILDRVDHIVNLPRLGKHVLAGATLGLKNAVGWISDHSRMVLHRDGATFQEKIAEINAIPQIANKLRLTLTLVDRALTTYGPDSGYPLVLKHPVILASEDIASHDQAALMTLLWGRQQTPADWLSGDPYPRDSNGFNWHFVRTKWGEDAIAGYQDLTTFDDFFAANAQTHINYAFDLLRGGRPAVIELVTGDMALDDSLIATLTSSPELHIRLAS